MSRVVVTGAAGFIGRDAVAEMNKLRHVGYHKRFTCLEEAVSDYIRNLSVKQEAE